MADKSELAKAYAAAFAEIEGATKSAENEAFKRGGKASKYADLTSVIEAVKPALIKHSLFFTQRPVLGEGGITLETILGHAGGEEMSLGTLFVPANRNDAHAYGSALTYARRYALVTAFGVPVEDDDGNAAARGQSEERTVSPSPPKKLDGPYTSKTALQTAVKQFVHEMNGCGDDTELSLFLMSKGSQDLIEQVKRDFPEWWDGGPSMPEEFVPLSRQIEVREYEMAQLVSETIRAG